MTVWIPAEQPPAIRLATWVRLADDSIRFAKYSQVNNVWRTADGRVVWPVEWQWSEPDPEPESDSDASANASDGGGQRRKGDDWLTCSVDRFVDYWMAGWESGAIERPAHV